MSGIYINSYDFQFLKGRSLGGRLRFFRQHMLQYHGSDYSITSLGSRIGVAPQSISAVERGDSNNPSFQLVHKLTQEYSVPLESVTDEFYSGKEKLFPIGKPDTITLDDEDFTFEDEFPTGKWTDHYETLDDYFADNDVKGLLLYHCVDKKSITPLFHTHLKVDITHDEIFQLVSRLIFETSMLKADAIDENKDSHPMTEANDLLDNIEYSLSADELFHLLSERVID
ncbi:helix-turn-helix transcriptional regulator [Lentibacillus sp. N15]|uniref:helix-turn-helix domain-containing protein n=1 Tax=Lentibacillus songyuanensis TaxID=3136161 RepID=UPI0031BBAC11